jgi:uncharacterized protein with GYD domain
METFVMATRMDPAAAHTPKELEDQEKRIMDQVRATLPDVQWEQSYAVLGPWQYIDVFRAPDNDTAHQVAVLFQTVGQTEVEVWPVSQWGRFKDLIRKLPDPESA